jgi:hypothetical protein
MVCGTDGVAIFDALHRRGMVGQAMLQAFDLLELNGEDYRPFPLSRRKSRLAQLLKHSSAGIEFNDYTDADGAAVFRQACAMGLEGIVSKRLAAPYRSGPSRDWIKVKNPDSPAMIRAREGHEAVYRDRSKARLFANLSFQSKNSRIRLSRICRDDCGARREVRWLVSGGRLRVPASVRPRALQSAAQAGPVIDMTAMIATAAGLSGSFMMASILLALRAAAAVTAARTCHRHQPAFRLR